MKKRGIFSSRRASTEEQSVFFFGEIILIGIVFLILLSYVNSIRDDTLMEKNYLSRDLALIVDSIYSAPGNIEYSYSFKDVGLEKFVFGFRKQRAVVVEENSELEVKFPYAENLVSFKPLHITNINDKTLGFVKAGNNFNIQKTDNLNRISCNDVSAPKHENDDILIDYGGSDSGHVNEETNEAEITRSIANSFKILSTEEDINVDFTWDVEHDSEISLDERLGIVKDKSPEIFISIRVGSRSDNSNYAKAFVPEYSKKSAELACNIINSLLDRYDDITGVSIIPSKDAIVNANDVSVLLELGNIQNEKNIIKRHTDTAQAIIGGIKDYWE